jgi:glycosyltransferase involved in cell wall biosynthesis
MLKKIPAPVRDRGSANCRLDDRPIDQPKVCQVIACVNQNIGGPALSVTSLANTLTQYQIESHLWTLNYTQHGVQLKPATVQFHSYPATFLARHFRGFQPIANQGLHQLARELDLIHNHGVWMFPNLYARQAAQQHQLPLVISPRGMLETWSLNHSQVQKRLAWLLYERENMRQATLFHATSPMEVESIRRLGLKQPIALIPNGVSVPSIEQLPARTILSDQFPELANKRWLLFFSRLHPKKGLDLLLNVWKTLEAQFSDWQLVIAGPDLSGYQAKLLSLVEALNLHRVTFTGMISGETKASALGNADLFVLPSHSENFGIAIAESLSYAVPVIATQGTPWQDLQKYNCGWWIENTATKLTQTLIEAMQLSDQQRRSMGLNGRTWVTTRHSWDAIAHSMSEVYRWILNGGDAPQCVQVSPFN